MNFMISVAVWNFNWCVQYRDMKIHPVDRIKLVEFYESNIGQAIYSLRSKSIEPLIEQSNLFL